jgi:hypothetical protein
LTPLIDPHAIGAALAMRGAITTTAINAAILILAPVTSRAPRFENRQSVNQQIERIIRGSRDVCAAKQHGITLLFPRATAENAEGFLGRTLCELCALRSC